MKNKNKNKSLIIISMLILVFTFSSVTALHSTATYSAQGAEYFNNGYVINLLIDDDITVNENYTVYFTPYLLSGKTVQFDALGIICRFGLIGQQGEILYLASNENMTGLDDIWVIEIDKSYLNETGDYLYNLDCQSNSFGGYINGELDIIEADDSDSELNFDITDTKNIIFMVLFVLAIGSLIYFGYVSIAGFSIFVLGFILLISGIHFIFSGIILLLGLLLIIKSDK